MRFVTFSLFALLTLSAFYLLNQPIQVGDKSIPPPGFFFSPYTGFWQNAEAVHPITDAISLQTSQLHEPITVFMDDRLVPHIYARNPEDAIFAQGFLHAKYRLWQLDISVRAAGGRLSEIVGPIAIPADRRKRQMGFRTAAAAAVNEWMKSVEAVKFLNAYTNGINYYIEQLRPRDYPLEFKLMNYAPEPWSFLKTALFRQAMIETLCIREYDLEETNSLHLLGDKLFESLFPFYNKRQSPIIPEGTEWDFSPLPHPQPNTKTYIGAVDHQPFPKPPPYVGSNNWAVSGEKTTTGYPILCNDPHLNLTLPSIWYEMHINGESINVYGASLPGAPGILIGFNENIAWGETNVGQDVSDWYRIHWADEGKNSYKVDDKVLAVEKVVEIIKVKGQEDIIDTVRYTQWGPIVYEEENHPKQDMAMQWTGLMVPEKEEVLTFLKINQAKNYDEFIQALSNYASPPQNFVFASKEGDIAMQIGGKFPIRTEKQGRFILEGDNSENDWKGFIPFTHLPGEKNPPRDFVSSANQHTTAQDYPYPYYGHFDDYRGRYLFRKLQETSKVGTKEMQALQNDNFSILAEEAVPLLMQYVDSTLFTSHPVLLAPLQNWDFRFEKDSKAAVVFTHWFDTFYELVWDELSQNKEQLHARLPEKWRTIEILEEEPEHPLFDHLSTPAVEDAGAIVNKAFFIADSILQAKYNYKQNGLPDWELDKSTFIPHLGKIPAFKEEYIPVGGYRDALNSIKKSNGPSWRMIIELGKENKGFGVYPGGQSGNPGSPFYDNFIETWTAGDYYPLHISGSITSPGFEPFLKINFTK